MPVEHYENFPVASLLVPRAQRPAVEALYAFARGADDVADEGELTAQQRLAGLAEYQRIVDAIERGEALSAPMDTLAKAVRQHQLPTHLLRELLDAFSQDVVQTRYHSFDDLLEYCRRSANPIGRLMLRLFDADTPSNLVASDAICSALQLINFWQDIAIDWSKGRIYLPQQDLRRFGLSDADIAAQTVTPAWRQLMAFELERTRAMMLVGAPLARRLGGRFGWEIRLVVQGGLRILERIEAVDYDVFARRPLLQKSDWPRLVWRAATMKP